MKENKIAKNIVVLVLCTAVCIGSLLLTSCNDTEDTDAVKTVTTTEATTEVTTAESEKEEETAPFAGDVLYDANGIKITANEFRHYLSEISLEVTVENNTDTELQFLLDISAVDNYVTLVNTTNKIIASGERDVMVMRVDNKQLDIQMIDEVYSLEVRINAAYTNEVKFLVKDAYAEISLPDVDIETDIGEVVCSENNLEVRYLGTRTSGENKYAPIFQLTNNSESLIECNVDSVTINGIDSGTKYFLMESVPIPPPVAPGKQLIFVPDLSDLGLAKGSTLEIKLGFCDTYDSGSVILTEPIVINID